MTKKIRLLPVTIILMSMILGIRIVDFSFGVQESFAQDPAPETEIKHEEKKGNDKAVKEETPEQKLSSVPTRKEIEYLQKLSERREQLDRRAQELDDRETVLTAVELRITERTNSLKKIEKTIEAALKKHDALEKAQLDSLVKIYSAMKPKDAAHIFNDLDDDVLLSIVENMKEKKMGAILAKMNLDKAKKLTVSLATRMKLPKIEG